MSTCPHCGAETKERIDHDRIRYECETIRNAHGTNQHVICLRRELIRLRAIVGPLERLIDSGLTACIDLDSGVYQVEVFDDRSQRNIVSYNGRTLAEALAAAEKELEDGT